MDLATALLGLLIAAEPQTGVSAPEEMTPLLVELPMATFHSGPRNLPRAARLDPRPVGPPAPVLVPRDVRRLSRGCPVTASDAEPVIGGLAMVTDGDKDHDSSSFMELGPGTQWVQVDLKAPCEVWAIVLWHFHSEPRIYRDVIVQVADDAAFSVDVRTLFNNDHDDSSGRGVGQDYEYVESNWGLMVPGKGTRARFIRCWSRGNTANDLNHYVEVEAWGR